MKTTKSILLCFALFAISYNGYSQTKKSCVITSVSLDKMPGKQSSGYNWDMGSGPDVFFNIMTQDEVLYTSKQKSDLDIGSLPTTYSSDFPKTLPYLNQLYKITFLEYDGASANDIIGKVTFNPKDYPKYPASVELTNGDGLVITLNLQWE